MSDLFSTGLDDIKAAATALAERIQAMATDAERVEALNAVRGILHAVSPMRAHPVDLVVWVPADQVHANDYNPNVVAGPEMKLLAHSIGEDGYTQPVVSWVRDDGQRETVDGFHRGEVGRKNKAVRKTTMGYLPVTTINDGRRERTDRMASTIRHNRARGRHTVDGMSDIIVDLARRNWSDAKIAKELGMEPDEVLRLKQVSGLAEMFADREFSEAWEVA